MSAPVQATVRGSDGAERGSIELPAAIFDERPREHLVYEVAQMQMANRRAGTASSKTRSEVSGGGRKPWAQKGTGRARAGSSRSPIWEGGAVVHGPRPRDWSYRLPGQARRVALCSVLSDRCRSGALLVVDSIELPEPKTKRVVELLRTLDIRESVLIVDGVTNDGLERAARNLPNVKVLRTEGVNVYDVLRYRRLVLTRQAVNALVERLGR